jgi:hypothetical protein
MIFTIVHPRFLLPLLIRGRGWRAGGIVTVPIHAMILRRRAAETGKKDAPAPVLDRLDHFDGRFLVKGRFCDPDQGANVRNVVGYQAHREPEVATSENAKPGCGRAM